MPAVLVDLDDRQGLQPAEQRVGDGPNDLPYFVGIAQTAAGLTPDVERFVISYSRHVGRLLSTRDVWLLVGDERATPLPGDAVCPVFKTHGERFGVPARGLRADPLLTMAEVALWSRNWASAIWRNRQGLPHRRRSPSGWLPLGAPAFPSPPPSVPKVEKRSIDVGFRGSTRGPRSYAPKTISRQRMVSALSQLPVDVQVDLVETESFIGSYASDPQSYVEGLLDTKICLAPRGGSVETFRVFEGALAGCALITEPLPPAWFYAGLPRIELRSWTELPEAIRELRSDAGLIRRMAQGAREWALHVVSPGAIGQWVARQLEHGP